MEMMTQSGILAIIGIGIVFGFLLTLVFCITLIGKFFHTLSLNNDVLDTTFKKQPYKESTVDHGVIVASITAAINKHRT
jgi:oxaloacetate decarboxylase gamma subunit